MSNMLDDIEKVVDDFSLEEKKEEKNHTFKEWENFMLNERLKMVAEEHHREAARRQELELRRQYHESLKDDFNVTQRNDIYSGDLRTDKMICHCGKNIEVIYRAERIMARPYEFDLLSTDNTYFDVAQNVSNIRFYCGFCGTAWVKNGLELIALKNY